MGGLHPPEGPRVVLRSGREPLYLFEKCNKKSCKNGIFTVSSNVALYKTTHVTVGSLRSHRDAQSADGRRLPVPRVLRVPKKLGCASRVEAEQRRDLRQPPAVSACPPLQLPAWERRASASGIEICHLNPGTPQKPSCASTRGPMKSQRGGRCKAL